MGGRCMYNIVICDDDSISIASMEDCLFDLMENTNYSFDIETYQNGEKFLKHFFLHKKIIDILFLDIEMGEKSGIEIAKKIRQINSEMIIIFFSSHEKYMIDLFEVNPFRFIPKPINQENVQKIMLSAISQLNLNHQFFEYTYKQKLYKHFLKEIVYFESKGRIINVIGKDNTLLGNFYSQLNDVEETLKTDRFLRVHQSYLVNYDWIKMLSQKKVETFDKQIVQVSEERSKKVREKYIHLVRRETGI